METRVKIEMTYEADTNHSVFGRYLMTLQEASGNAYIVRLKFNFDELWEITRDTTSVAFDFMVFSMAVYNADRMVSRTKYSTDGWNRSIELVVPVLNIEAMNRAVEHLTSAINFLTGDDWTITFVQANPYTLEGELHPIDTSIYEKVSLFSGGLDSLIGFVDSCQSLSSNKKVLLVSHKELGKEWADQKRILDTCNAKNIYSNKYDQVLINAGINNIGWIGERSQCEGTFRARSILFFGAGIYCAHSINPNMDLIIPENGTISLNIPLDKGRRSACSTRTTHPVFIKRLQKALAEIGITNKLTNPYQLKSKADMVADCCRDEQRKFNLELLYKYSCSCAKRSHKHSWSHRKDTYGNPILHCGFCLPCLYRRVSLSQVGWDTEPIGVDVFNSLELDVNDTTRKKGNDFRSLLYFLKYRCNRETIEEELIANGVTDLQEIETYTAFLIHSYNQVKDWLRLHGNEIIKKLAGL